MSSAAPEVTVPATLGFEWAAAVVGFRTGINEAMPGPIIEREFRTLIHNVARGGGLRFCPGGVETADVPLVDFCP
jgi:hypothetical protein